MAWASIIMHRERMRVAVSVATTSRVAPVSALMGLKQRFPHSLIQMSSRMFVADGRLEARFLHRRTQLFATLGGPAVGLAEGELVAVDVLDDAGLDDHRGRVDDAAHGPLRPDGLPLPAAGIDAFQTVVPVGSLELVEVPPGHAVHGRHHHRLRTQQGPEATRRVVGLVRLQADDDVVLGTGFPPDRPCTGNSSPPFPLRR